MARIEYVKKAQARYARVPVLNEDGTPQTKAVTVRGKVQHRAVTVADKTKPLPPRTCEACRQPIAIGSPYKQVSPRYGGTRYRCGACPAWKPWDLSDSVAVHLDRIATEYADRFGDIESVEDAEAVFAEAAEEVRELASRRTDAADNMESGFGHETEMSERLREHGDELESFADELEQADIPDAPDETADCDECGGTGKVEDADDESTRDCDECGGTGEVERSEEQLNDWIAEVQGAFEDAMSNAPYGEF